MLSRKLRLYLPFVAVIVVQAIFVALAPSNAVRSASGFDATGGAGSFAPSGLEAPDQQGGGGGSATDAGAGGAAGDPGGAGGGANPAGGSPTGSVPSGDGTVLSGDTSHCVGPKQFDELLNAVACKPAWPDGADNGGATYRGVTADKIRIVMWEHPPNQAVDSILATQGLASTPQDRAALDAAAKQFIDENYELYGRELDIVRIVTDCPTSPIDVPRCKSEARRIVEEHQPFMVVIGGVGYPEVYDEFARAGVISLGGWHWPKSYFEGRRPYRWDLFADGDQSAEIVAEYFCKKMADKPAANSGRLIHAQIGGRDSARRVGIIAPERDTDKIVADVMAAKLGRCGQDAVVQTYSPDINEASGQADTIVQRLISEKVTTVVCFCDPVVPVYLFQAMSNQTYFPEHLTTGTGLLDYDKLARLYDTKQWVHAFGPGHLFDPLPFDQQEVSRMWRATGRTGVPCSACNLLWSYYALVGGLIHYAGPNLTPATAEAGVFAAQPYGGDRPGSVLVDYGPGDYGAISDAREIYWSATATSKIDNQVGAYVTVSGASRYEIGEWTTEFRVPAAAQ